MSRKPSAPRSKRTAPQTLTGAQIVWECLVRERVSHVFGYPGGAILPVYDSMANYPVHHVLARHEQGAVHMADGYARAGGGVGVALATSGPGATNMVTGIATAMMDSSPVVCITGQVSSSLIGSDAFQETDITGVTLPITKHNYLVTEPDEIAPAMREAFYIARSGRPGPVLVDITKDAQQGAAQFDWDAAEPKPPGYRPDHRPRAAELRQALELINSARRPVMLVGHGVALANAEAIVRTFAERTTIPVAMTLLGIGAFPASHPLNLGMMGLHGESWVNEAVQQADLLIALGMRFDDRVTGKLANFAPNARKIHVEIDPAEVNKIITVDVGLIGDVRDVIEGLLPDVEPNDHSAWLERIAELRTHATARGIQSFADDGRLYAAHAIHDLWQATSGNAVVVSDVGQHQMWEAQYYRHEAPRSLITSGGLGPMGFALPAAIGAKLARPDANVWVVCGDGGFQMTMCKLGTMIEEGVKVNIAIINNSCLGMVRQIQEFFYGGRYRATPLVNPDFVTLASAYGIRGIRVTDRPGVTPAVEAAQAHDGPVLLDIRVESDDAVYPTVAAGAGLDQMIRRPAQEIVDELHIGRVHVEDKPGVLNRVASLFRRRAFNIESLTVGHTETPGVSRMTIVVGTDRDGARKVEAHLYKLVNVLRVDDVTSTPAVFRDLAMIKVAATPENRSHVMQLVDVYRARIVDVAPDPLMVEVTGTEDKIDSLLDVLRPYGVIEAVRTGRVAMARGDGRTPKTRRWTSTLRGPVARGYDTASGGPIPLSA